MSTTQHVQFQEFVRDIIIGMADGLTVPFALAAGLAGALPTTRLVVTAGFSEIAAGCIAMGLGAYLAIMSDHDFYHAQHDRKMQDIVETPDLQRAEVGKTLRDWAMDDEQVEKAVNVITHDSERWIGFMMKYRLGVEHPAPKRARNSSLTIGLSYVVGGMIPLTPYMGLTNRLLALGVSIFVTLLALFIFGFTKGRLLGTNALKGAVQTMLVGGLAAGVAYVAARWIA